MNVLQFQRFNHFTFPFFPNFCLIPSSCQIEDHAVKHLKESFRVWSYRVFFSKGHTQKSSKYGNGPSRQDKIAKNTGPTKATAKRILPKRAKHNVFASNKVDKVEHGSKSAKNEPKRAENKLNQTKCTWHVRPNLEIFNPQFCG